MLFEKETLAFNILDVLELKQRNVHMLNSGRNFHALSFRFCSDAVLKSETNAYPMQGNEVCYVPARLDYSRIAGVDELIVVHFELVNYKTRDIEHFVPQKKERFAALFQKILQLWRRKDAGYKYQCSAVLYEIFAECYAQHYKQEQHLSRIAASVEYMNQHYQEADLSITEIAEKSYMSEVYFRKIFQSEYGMSPKKHIISLRIQHAAGLISTGYYSLKEVAYLSGYTDYKYFSVEFKKIIGVSPSAYLYNYSE